MRRVCSSWPVVMSAIEASVRYETGRGVVGRVRAAVRTARSWAASSDGAAVPAAIFASRASHSS